MVTQLPIVRYEQRFWYFDKRLRQVRNVFNPHDFQNLNDFEMDFFSDKIKEGKPTTLKFYNCDNLMEDEK